jgi:1-acyl-sn-glycerol-3-phosphate acyltransferase
MIIDTAMAFWTILTTTIYTVIIGIPLIITAFFSKSGKLPYVMGKSWAWLIMKTNRVKIQIEGFENILRTRSYVFISNHSSNLDPPAVALALQNQLRFVGKKSLGNIPIFGWAVHLARMILIDRSDSTAARDTLNKAISDLKDGISACFFAEGTRSMDGRLQKFKKGGIMLALKARLPIVPITVIDTHKLLPKNCLRIRSGVVRIIVGDPIDVSAYSEKDRDILLDKVRSVIRGNLQRLSQAYT